VPALSRGSGASGEGGAVTRFGLRGGRSARDGNEPEIVAALQTDGVLVQRIDDARIGDLLVWWDEFGRAAKGCGLLEVKSIKGKMRPLQLGWMHHCAEHRIRYAVVRSPEQAREQIARWRRGSL
jgi:hypothetical protein